MEEATPKAPPAAYLPFKTFLSAIETLDQGLPRKLDRTIWRSQSGIVQGQIMMALRFLKLINENDEPTIELVGLVSPENKEDRPKILGVLAQKVYRSVFAHDLTKMTPKMLEDAMGEYGVQGDTRRKAVAFFLRIAKYAELPMHPLLAAQTRNSMAGPRRRKRKNAEEEANGIPDGTATSPSVFGDPKTKAVRLPSGTVITLTIDANWLEMSTAERAFVFGLVDALQKAPTGPRVVIEDKG